ncbi:membrane protein [Gordonia phage Untouchable]|uniref:Membrane protein n=1 Tax=Gordonia phage Untouchable TaxID=2656542 RepID=A0A649VBG6_9CAUD|nr:membrane protein [Gordonia phage Untouchable]QGJ89113.1 membrane protein [Gordonia phage Untouchable]
MEWWSWVLTSVGMTGIFLTTQKMIAGFAVGLGAQGLWIVYATTTSQYGFIFSAFGYGTINAIGLWKWRRDAKKEELMGDPPPIPEGVTLFTHLATDDTYFPQVYIEVEHEEGIYGYSQYGPTPEQQAQSYLDLHKNLVAVLVHEMSERVGKFEPRLKQFDEEVRVWVQPSIIAG